nr:hypothetical protein Iba_chr13eCG4570 [Ipomoea batatas]
MASAGAVVHGAADGAAAELVPAGLGSSAADVAAESEPRPGDSIRRGVPIGQELIRRVRLRRRDVTPEIAEQRTARPGRVAVVGERVPAQPRAVEESRRRGGEHPSWRQWPSSRSASMWPRNAARAHSATPARRSLSFFEPPLPLNWITASE